MASENVWEVGYTVCMSNQVALLSESASKVTLIEGCFTESSVEQAHQSNEGYAKINSE